MPASEWADLVSGSLFSTEVFSASVVGIVGTDGMLLMFR